MKNRIDKKLFAILIGYMAAYHVVYISKMVILKFMNEPGYIDISWARLLFGTILCNFVFLMPPIIILIMLATKRMIDQNLGWLSSLGLHFFFSLVYFFLVIFWNTIYNYYVYGESLDLFNREALLNVLYGSTLNFLGYVGFITIIYSYYYVQRIRKSEKQKVELTRQLQYVKMQALKSQLNPHFLFNTLNSISSLIKEDAHKAQHMIGNLGDLFRQVLLVQDENMISVHKEMLILNKYLEIMRTRFSDHLLINIMVNKEMEEALIPSMLIQPILENSIKYGYSYESINLEVNLSIFEDNGYLVVEIQNNGPSVNEDGQNWGLGIANIRERLRTLFEDRFSFSFSNLENEQGVMTSIKIPLVLS